jgi:putative membrane protein
VIALWLAVGLVLVPVVASAQSPTMDRKWVKDVLQSDMADIELGTLASGKASSDAVKQFGKRTAEEHARISEELKKLAQGKGIQPPDGLDQPHRWLRDTLGKRAGAAFDALYVSEMVKDHRKDVMTFDHAARKAQDPAVKAFAAKTLPALKEHLRLAQDLRAQLARR